MVQGTCSVSWLLPEWKRNWSEDRVFAEAVVKRFFLTITCFMWSSSSFLLPCLLHQQLHWVAWLLGCAAVALTAQSFCLPDWFGASLTCCDVTEDKSLVCSTVTSVRRERYRTSGRKMLVPDSVGGSPPLSAWLKQVGRQDDLVVERKSLVIFHTPLFLPYVSVKV